MSRPIVAIALSFLLAGCGSPEVTRMTSPEDAGTDAADATPPVEAGPIIRSVETRNPFGNTFEDNLMVDGDFELTAGQGQYGWLAFGSMGQATLSRETGGLCHSGLTCGVMTNETDLLGAAAAPDGKPIDVSVYTKPPVADCGLTQVSLINCAGAAVVSFATLSPTTAEPDASGWCQHVGTAPPQALRPCLYVVSAADPGQRTLVDEASLTAADGSGSSSVSSGPPSPELYERASRAIRAWHQRMPIGRTNPPLVP